MPKPKTPKSLKDLNPAPYNAKVREITAEAIQGLSHSIERFGDLSGITFNLVTGNLVTGHQRLAALIVKYGASLTFHPHEGGDGASVLTPDGHQFVVRYVSMTPEEEKAANLAANSEDIQGSFLWEGVKELLEELNVEGFDMADTGFLPDTYSMLLAGDFISGGDSGYKQQDEPVHDPTHKSITMTPECYEIVKAAIERHIEAEQTPDATLGEALAGICQQYRAAS